MSDLQIISDDSDLRKYRIELPNIIDDLGLNPYEGRLYMHYKRVCGANGGTCTEGTRGTARRSKMSAGQVSKARDGLAGRGLIAKIESGQYVHVKIVDIWELNFAYFLTENRSDISGWTIQRLKDYLKSVHCMNTSIIKRSPDEHSDKKRSPDEHSVHTVNTSGQKCSYSETKKEQKNKNQPIKEEDINSSLSCSEIWQQVEPILANQMTKATFLTIFPGTALARENGHYVVTTPSPAALDWLEHRLAGPVEHAVSAVAGEPAKVYFKLQEN